MNLCTLYDPEVRQCCCACRYRLTDYFHCSTAPAFRRSHGACICGFIKGYICQPPEFDGRAYSQWPEHSVGCEMFTRQEGA